MCKWTRFWCPRDFKGPADTRQDLQFTARMSGFPEETDKHKHDFPTCSLLAFQSCLRGKKVKRRTPKSIDGLPHFGPTDLAHFFDVFLERPNVRKRTDFERQLHTVATRSPRKVARENDAKHIAKRKDRLMHFSSPWGSENPCIASPQRRLALVSSSA